MEVWRHTWAIFVAARSQSALFIPNAFQKLANMPRYPKLSLRSTLRRSAYHRKLGYFPVTI